jgi:hypothetical protein
MSSMKLLTPFRSLPRRLTLAGMGLLLALGLAVPATALAAPGAPATCDLACVQAFGNQQIANRLTSLGTLASKVTTAFNAGHITSAQNTFLQNDVTNNVNGLNSLKTTLDSATDEAAARADVKLIYLQFRIYAVVLPRDFRLLHIDIEGWVDGKLRALQPTIEALIAQAPANEKPQLESLYSDYKAQLGEAEAQMDAAQGQYGVLTPQNFNNDPTAYKNAFDAYVSDEEAAQNALHHAGSDLHQMVQIVKSNTSSGSSGATPTATSGV